MVVIITSARAKQVRDQPARTGQYATVRVRRSERSRDPVGLFMVMDVICRNQDLRMRVVSQTPGTSHLSCSTCLVRYGHWPLGGPWEEGEMIEIKGWPTVAATTASEPSLPRSPYHPPL